MGSSLHPTPGWSPALSIYVLNKSRTDFQGFSLAHTHSSPTKQVLSPSWLTMRKLRQKHNTLSEWTLPWQAACPPTSTQRSPQGFQLMSSPLEWRDSPVGRPYEGISLLQSFQILGRHTKVSWKTESQIKYVRDNPPPMAPGEGHDVDSGMFNHCPAEYRC